MKVGQRECEVGLGADRAPGGQVGRRRTEEANRALVPVRRQLRRRARAARPRPRNFLGSRRDVRRARARRRCRRRGIARPRPGATPSGRGRARRSLATANASCARHRSAWIRALVDGRANERMSERDRAVRRSSRPAACAGTIAFSSKSSSSPARQIDLASPVGSAAATSKSRWVGGGSLPICRRKCARVPGRLRTARGAARLPRPGRVTAPDRTRRARAGSHARRRGGGRGRGRRVVTWTVCVQQIASTPPPRAGEGRSTGARRTVVVLDRVPHRHQQADAVGVEPPGEEPERVGAVLVQPLRVVDDDQQLPSRRGGGDECQRSETDQELIRRHVVAHPEGRLQCASLRRRQRVDAIEERRQELVQGREAESHLGLDADEAHDVEVRRRRCHGVEQARLADSGLSTHHEDTAQPVPRALDEPADLGVFGLAADERGHACEPGRHLPGPSSAARCPTRRLCWLRDSGAIEVRRGLRGGWIRSRAVRWMLSPTSPRTKEIVSHAFDHPFRKSGEDPMIYSSIVK